MEDQWEYWLGVSVLLYLVKHSCLDLANMTRELLKVNDGANPAAYNILLPLIKYVWDKKSHGFKIEPTGNSDKPSEIICFSNSKYVGDLVSIRSINGFIL